MARVAAAWARARVAANAMRRRGSLEDTVAKAATEAVRHSRVISVSGVNRAPIRGSFLISTFATIDGKRVHLGSEAVLSRWSVKYCANCQTHLEVKSFVGLRDLRDAPLDPNAYEVEIRTRDGVITRTSAQAGVAPAAALALGKKPFRVEVR